jgi:hypothetical protein
MRDIPIWERAKKTFSPARRITAACATWAAPPLQQPAKPLKLHWLADCATESAFAEKWLRPAAKPQGHEALEPTQGTRQIRSVFR